MSFCDKIVNLAGIFGFLARIIVGSYGTVAIKLKKMVMKIG